MDAYSITAIVIFCVIGGILLGIPAGIEIEQEYTLKKLNKELHKIQSIDDDARP